METSRGSPKQYFNPQGLEVVCSTVARSLEYGIVGRNRTANPGHYKQKWGSVGGILSAN